jgi:hypothetical protein
VVLVIEDVSWEDIPGLRESVEERLLTHRRIVPCPALGSDCWESTYKPNRHGYCSISVDGKTERVHRVAWKLWRGRIPPEYTIDHLCENEACFHPDHLDCVTDQENRRRQIERNRIRTQRKRILWEECGYRVWRRSMIENNPERGEAYIRRLLYKANHALYNEEG